MYNYYVIGNPIDHSLSPVIHNYWFKKYKIVSRYEKKELEENDLKIFIDEMRNNEFTKGANITVPFKKKIIPFLDRLTHISEKTQSVNTIVKENNKLIGHNTDVNGLIGTLENLNWNASTRSSNFLIIGAGGVTPSAIYALHQFLGSDATFYIIIGQKKMLQL